MPIPIDPLIRVLPPWQEPIDQRIAGRRSTSVSAVAGPTSRGSHLNNWIVFGRKKKSSISPS